MEEDENLVEGFEENDEGGGSESTGEHKTISVEKNDRSVFELKSWAEEGDLNLNPGWQRNFVWDTKRKSQLIESILLGFPIPVIYLSQDREGKYEVVDGLQRITSVISFINNEFPLQKDLTLLPDLKGKKYKELPEKEQSKIKKATLRTYELSPHTQSDMLFEIFKRLNTGGVKLNEMEIRNCIFRGKLNDLICLLADDQEFKNLLNSPGLSNRMDDRALILRFFAFYERGWRKYRKGLKRFLNDYFQDFQNPRDEKISEYKEKFIHCIRCCRSVFGENAFRTRTKRKDSTHSEWSSRINAAVFQVISASFSEYSYHQVVEKADLIYEAYVNILDSDKEWLDFVTSRTGDTNSVHYTFELWEGTLKEIMKSPLSREPRAFSKKLKESMFRSNNVCKACEQEIKTMDDAHLDHEEHYWKGGKTVPENARLLHRICNLKRSNG
jgi:uncharacterized protein with ParB-like and HNH nuclease domain